ncbi:hypothetical protein LSH36_217g05099 [Paralvinella palmiformis]|uniref:Meteorin-like protein n=1 Tax=Paralvinella palmiformis TaxID=53620 RepID=A0AAD9JN56_9ANNE|nr:hypothetical protein LSH36_217g05099 [Paralvinella palmiformis]
MDWSALLALEILMIFTLCTVRVGSLVQDHCDTTLWDSGDDSVGVHDVSGRCAEGHIQWRTPFGALRISLQPKIQRKSELNATFEACILSSAYHTTVKFSLDDPETGLQPLAVLSSGLPRMSGELCFRSSGGPVVLYVESELLRESVALSLVQVDYDIRHLPGPGQRQDKDCRPCTDKEVLEAVCSSDVVFSGTIDHVMHHPELDETMLHLKVTKMIRQRTNLATDTHHRRTSSGFRSSYPRLRFLTEYGVKDWPPNEAASPSFSDPDIGQSDSLMIAPHRCGIKKGFGEFLFTGRIRFKKTFLHCAPRVEEFVKLWKRAKVKGHNLCTLD